MQVNKADRHLFADAYIEGEKFSFLFHYSFIYRGITTGALACRL